MNIIGKIERLSQREVVPVGRYNNDKIEIVLKQKKSL